MGQLWLSLQAAEAVVISFAKLEAWERWQGSPVAMTYYQDFFLAP